MKRTFKYKLRMNRRFQERCEQTLNGCRDLYNAALSQRIAAYKTGAQIGFAQQSRQLTQARELPEVGALLRSFQINVLRRLDEAYQGFFRRARARHGKAGLPRFKGYERYHSITTRQAREFRLEGDRLIVQKLGSCRVRLSRSLEGRPRTLTIRRECDGWYVEITCDQIEPKPLSVTGRVVGIDVGIAALATLSTGETIENPRWFREGETALAIAQRAVARKTKGSGSRQRARRFVAKTHAKVKRRRAWFHWQQARSLVARFDLIAVENLNIKGLAQSNLSKSIKDVGWNAFIQKLLVKAEEAGRTVVKVSARFTSQDCSNCGRREKKDLSKRWHSCLCGAELSRDHNAAINILGRAVPDLKIEPVSTGG